MASTEQLIFEILAKDANASAAFDRFRSKVDDTSKSVDKNSASLDKNSGAMAKNAQSSKSALGALAGVGLAFAPITAGAAAAGLGVAAFSALAVPSAKKVVTALTGPGGIAASWDTLDNRQRNAALGIQALGQDYSVLARQMEPQVFQVFNQGLTLAHSLLGPVGQLAHTSGQGISDFLAQFSADSGVQQFFAYLSTVARPAIDSLGSDVTHVSHAVFQLLQSFSGAGILELRLLTGVFTALDDSISFLSQHAPGLTSAALGIGGIALALSKLGALSGALKITGLSSIAGQMAGFAAATEGASLAEKGLLASSTALEAITPFGWAVLGAAALTGLVVLLSKLKSGTDTTIGSIEKQNGAIGFNTQGYFDAAKALGQYNQTNDSTRESMVNLHTGLVTNTQAVGNLSGVTQQLTGEQQKLISEGRNQETFLTTLEQKYGITRDAAVSLAQHSGVLASQVNRGGSAMRQATAQAEAYANANIKARSPATQLTTDMQNFANATLTATVRQQALTAALKLFFDPAVAADQDLITLKNDQVALAKALQASGGQTGLLTQKQRDARGAFDTYLQQVATAASDAFTATGRTSSYTRIINDSLPALEAAAGKNRTLRQEIQNLIDTERGIKSEHVAISVSGQGHWSVSGGGPSPTTKHFAAAAGWRVTGGIPGVDSVPILAQQGETVLSVPQSRALAPILGAAGVPGYAGGGVVGSYAGMVPGLSKWLASENAATLNAIASSVASAFAAGAPGPSSGGGHTGWNPGAGVSQWGADVTAALRQLGLPAAYKLDVLYQMMTESGGNPNIVNKWDSNWLAGHPSVGLMQVIAGTFDTYAGPYRGTGPFSYGVSVDPMANIYAALNYGAHGAGFGTGSGQIGSGHGYDQGGFLPTGWSMAYNGTGKPEPVGPAAARHYTININVGPTAHKREVGREVVAAIQEFERGAGSGWRS